MARDRKRPPLRDAYPELFRKLGGEPPQSQAWREVWDEFMVITLPLIVVLVPAAVLTVLLLDWPLFSWQYVAVVVAVGVIARVAVTVRRRRQPRA